MSKSKQCCIILILSFVLTCPTYLTFVEPANAINELPLIELKHDGQGIFTDEKVYSSNQSVKLVLPTRCYYASNAIAYYTCQMPLNTIGSVQFYTAYTTACPRCMLSLDTNHDGLVDMFLLSDYQSPSNGQWKLITGGSQWGWTEATPNLLSYGKSWKSLEEWQMVYGDATVLKAGVGLEFWSVDPNGFDQPLYVDGIIITERIPPTPTPTQTPNSNTTEPVNSTKLQPTLNLNCSSSSSNVNFKVNVEGSLTGNESEPLTDEPILVSYSLTGGDSWLELTFLKTRDDGTFSSVWLPQATGNFLVRAEYSGSDIYQRVNSTVNIAVTESSQQTSIFSIYSNSTISELAFDSANHELSFSVSGEDGTSGYVNAFIPENLVGNTVSFNVNLDEKQILYTATLENDSWVISFNYHHSSHLVSMKMDSTEIPKTETPTTTVQPNNISQPDWIVTASIAAVATIIAVIATALVMKRNKR